jgi:hypothetical protein
VFTNKLDLYAAEKPYVHVQTPRIISLVFWLNFFFFAVSIRFDTFIILFPYHPPDKQLSYAGCISKVNFACASLSQMSSSATACQQSRLRIAVVSDSNRTDSNSWNSQEINLTLHQAVQMRHLLLTTTIIMIFYLVFWS